MEVFTMYIDETKQKELEDTYQARLKDHLDYRGSVLRRMLHYNGSAMSTQGYSEHTRVDMDLDVLDTRIKALQQGLTEQKNMSLIKALPALYDAMGIDEPERIKLCWNNLIQHKTILETIAAEGKWLKKEIELLVNERNQLLQDYAKRAVALRGC
jgi:hypothetical protein